MICPNCKIKMNGDLQDILTWCPKCGIKATIKNNGTVQYTDSDGKLYYPESDYGDVEYCEKILQSLKNKK